MNNLLELLGIESWKPVATALLLPPVPLLLLILIGARLILPRRGLGWLLILLGVLGIWFSTCIGTARLLNQFALHAPAPLSDEAIQALKTQARSRQPVAIVVLGGGMEALAPEYGVANLRAASLERLRYGLWLGRETGLPVAFSGGIGWAQREGKPEAQIAAQIAAQDFGRPLKWLEDDSRDTRENAIRTVNLLKAQGITTIVLVTHGYHMPRALAQFETAAAGAIRVQAAPMGLARRNEQPALFWIPSAEGFDDVRHDLRELLARALGA